MSWKIGFLLMTMVALMFAFEDMKHGFGHTPAVRGIHADSPMQTTNSAGWTRLGDTGIYYAWEKSGNLLVIDKARNISWEAKH